MQLRQTPLQFLVFFFLLHKFACGCEVCVEFTNEDGTLGTPGVRDKQCSALATALTSFFQQGAELAGFSVPEAGFTCTEQSTTRQVACVSGVEQGDVEPMADHFWQTGAMFDKAVGNMLGLGPVPCQDVGCVPEKHIRVYSPCLAPLDEHTRYPLVPDCPSVGPCPSPSPRPGPTPSPEQPQSQSQSQPSPAASPSSTQPSGQQPAEQQPAGQQPAAASPDPAAPSTAAPKPSPASSGGAPQPGQGPQGQDQPSSGTGAGPGVAGKGTVPPPLGRNSKKPPPPRKRASPPPRKIRTGTRN